VNTRQKELMVKEERKLIDFGRQPIEEPILEVSVIKGDDLIEIDFLYSNFFKTRFSYL
jgi:hypothetical protein